MKWLEIIELRSVGSNRGLIMKQLREIIDEVHKNNEQQKIKVYNRVAIDSDFSIHLIHTTKNADINGSPLGLQLVSILKEFGLVNHSVWLDKFSK